MTATQHPPHAVLGDIVIAYAKTIKTACNNRIRTNNLTGRDDTTYPDRRRAIEHDRTEADAMRALADTLRAHGCPPLEPDCRVFSGPAAKHEQCGRRG